MNTSLRKDLGEMTVKIEKEEVVTRQEVYELLLRAYLEMGSLDSRIRILEGRPQ